VIGHLLIIWGLVAVALAAAFLIRRRHKKGAEKPEYAVALGFVASSYGVLLGLLVAFGANHYNDVRHQAQAEADSLLALWNPAAAYPAPVRDRMRHELICYMRAIREDDWPSMERGSGRESPRALRFGDRLRATVQQLPSTGTRGQGSAYGRAQGLMGDADKARQDLLFFTGSGIPAVLWVVIYVGASLLYLLVALHYADRPAGRLVSLGSVVTLLTVVVATISILDQPYGAGARVGPTGLTHAIDLLRAGQAETGVFGACQALA
jgi:hypothetical protein